MFMIVLVAPALLQVQREHFELLETVEDVRLRIERDVLGYYEARLAGTAPLTRTDATGAEIWLVGSGEVAYHVLVHARVLEVVRIRRPDVGEGSITPQKPKKAFSARSAFNDGLGIRIHHWRDHAGYAPEALAAIAGVSVNDVRRLEEGDGVPDRILYEICRALGVRVDVRPPKR